MGYQPQTRKRLGSVGNGLFRSSWSQELGLSLLNGQKKATAALGLKPLVPTQLSPAKTRLSTGDKSAGRRGNG